VWHTTGSPSCSCCTLLTCYSYRGPWFLPSSVCRWHPSLWALPSVCNAGASEQHPYLHQWGGYAPIGPAEYCKDRSSLVYIQSRPPFATRVTHPSGRRLSQVSFRCPQPRHLHVSMRSHRRTSQKTVAAFLRFCVYVVGSSLSSALRSTVTGFVPRSVAVGLW